MGALEQTIKEYARGLGFDLVGITTSEPFYRDGRAGVGRIRRRLMDGLPWYTEERAFRASRPEALLPGAGSIISVAMSYLTGERRQHGPGPFGRTARYAWGRDYHQVIKDRLRELAEGLPARAGRPVATRIFVDDGPMMDRAAAERAGVGWFGKSTNILTPSHGSWVVLGEVITDIEMEVDRPLSKTCGVCTRCMDACPTGAIVAPYEVDNTRCISFLTIESRVAAPRGLRPLLGDWAFGCDVCQEVCPVNRKAAPGREPAFRQAHDNAAPALVPLLSMTDEAFRERYRDSPIKRTRRAGLVRNACIALGNTSDSSTVPALAQCLRAEESMVRLSAAWALGRIGGRRAIDVLRSALERECEPSVAEEIELSLAEMDAPARKR